MTFFHYFILSCFNSKKAMRTTTLYHLLKGKRTSSILSYGYFYEVLPFFSLFPKLNETQYNKVITSLINEDYLIQTEPNYVEISSTGINALENITLPEIANLNQLAYYKWDMAFFERVVFTTQVLSEKAYSNSHYLPIETNLFRQQRLKQWLNKQNESVTMTFYKEWDALIKSLPQPSHELILGQLVGNNHRGRTLQQLADSYEEDVIFTYVEFKNYWHALITLVLEATDEFPLFNSLINEERLLVKEDSYKQSADLFHQGYDVDGISRIRQLKNSTVTDHLIEEFIVTHELANIPDFSEEVRTGLNQLLNQKSEYVRWSYKEATEFVPSLSFYEFKFYQFYLVEKERAND